MRSEVRSTIGTFISGNKVNQLRSEEDKKASFVEKDPVASSILKKVPSSQLLRIEYNLAPNLIIIRTFLKQGVHISSV